MGLVVGVAVLAEKGFSKGLGSTPKLNLSISWRKAGFKN